jgi:TolA-binding protein
VCSTLAPQARADRTGQSKEAVELIGQVRFSEAAALLAPLLKEPPDPDVAYLHGYAAFCAGDHGAAFRSLAALAPFDQPGIGVHARYLIARIHHLAGERPEAAANYQAVVEQFDRQRKAAFSKLADPKLSEDERSVLSATVKGPAPDPVVKALFYWGVILSEFGQSDDAASKFAFAVQLAPDSPIAPEARLRGGVCAVQARKHLDAVALLTPILEQSQFADQAFRWLAKANYGLGATPVPMGRGAAALVNAQPDPRRLAQEIHEAVGTLKQAVAKLDSPTDRSARERRATVLLELGDMQTLDRAYKDAAATYAAVAAAGAGEDQNRTARLRQAIALQLAGDYANSDRVCLEIVKTDGDGLRAAEAMLRHAENALLSRSYDEAATRFNAVLAKYPDARPAHLARFGLAGVQYARAQYRDAAKSLAIIPADERIGDLLPASLMLADCQLRALPAEIPDDALSTARLVKDLEEILAPLEAYAQSKPNDPGTVDAYLRIGSAANRLQALLADPLERRRAFAKARRAYMAVIQQFPDHPLYPVALLENAKVIATYAGAAPAVNELSKFRVEPLSKSQLAPLAMIHLADAMRLRRKPDDALAALAELREKHGLQLAKDGPHPAWASLAKYEEGLALREAGQYNEAVRAFESLTNDFPARPEAKEAVLRIAQCRLDPAIVQVESIRRMLDKSGKPQIQAELLTKLIGATTSLRSAAQEVDKTTTALAASQADSPLLPNLRHEEAEAWRLVGEMEVEAQRRTLRNDAAQKLLDSDEARPTRRKARNLESALASVPLAPISSIPLQPGERIARERFRTVIDTAVEDSPLAAEARMELAELHAARGETGPAIELLSAAVAAESQPELTERLRVRLASLYLEKGDAASAKSAAEPVVETGRNAYAVYARVVLIEALYRLSKWEAVIDQAATLRAAQKTDRIAGVSDHALLRAAQAQQKLAKWDDSRQTLESLLARFGRSTPLLRETQSALAMAYEKLNQLDKATALRQELTKTPSAALATDSPNPDTLTPRLPNLLTESYRRSIESRSKSPGQSAAALATPPVNNLDGTETLAPIALTARGIDVEILPTPQPLAFDAEPYVKSPAAPDDRDPVAQ